MDYYEMAQQTRIESDMLHHIEDALRSTMELPVQGPNFGQKLSTLRFITQSFQRHLEHLMALEENDGYMTVVLESSPQLSKKVDALREEHEIFRKGISRILYRLEHVSPTDKIRFGSICEELRKHLLHVDEHFRKEALLLAEALERDVGGEG